MTTDQMKREVMQAIKRQTQTLGMTQQKAAIKLGIDQPRVSHMLRGQVDKFKLETLVEYAAQLGVRVRLVVSK